MPQPCISGGCFLYELRITASRFPLWAALPSSEYYQLV